MIIDHVVYVVRDPVIDWPNSEGRLQRWAQKYQRVGHASAPIGFSELTISGSEGEMRDWLGPHELPMRFVDGSSGLVEARIATPTGDIQIA
ncbi:MAG TPA: hypothetical protein VI434_09125 [Candidatus Dormibacteraeota bacterium]